MTNTVAPIPVGTPAPEAPAAPQRVEDVGEPEAASEPQRYPEDTANLEFEWGTLFDSVALGISYVWLCCGVLLLLGLPLLLAVLWLRSKQRREPDE
jgi:hypothetical protein